GALVEPRGLISFLNQMNAANTAADGTNFQTSAGATITLTSLQNLTQRLTNGGAVTVTLDSAWAIANAIPNAFQNQTFPFTIITNAGTTVATPTLTGSGVTLSGTTTVLAAAARWYQGQLTQIATTTGAPVTSGTTAATIPGTVTVPVSQYQSGYTGIFSPLITITGMMATVTATMSV